MFVVPSYFLFCWAYISINTSKNLAGRCRVIELVQLIGNVGVWSFVRDHFLWKHEIRPSF